jgi:homospermidine synthase
MKKVVFDNKILMLGYGAVARCTLPILLEHIDVPLKNITILDFEDKSKELMPWTKKGLVFFRCKVTRDNLTSILTKHLSPGDLLIDLAWNIDCCDLLKWCHDNEVLYINTSVEEWDPKKGMTEKTPYEKTLYYRYLQIRDMSRDWEGSPTAVLEHGANPGLISHFVKKGLIDIAEKLIRNKRNNHGNNHGNNHEKRAERLKKLIAEKQFAELSMELGVKVIHCSERDTQITSRPKEVNEFVGTWSIEGLREEGTATSELGWGTHETDLPPLANVPTVGPKNQIFLSQMGINTWVRSWIPGQEILGMVIRHGEAFSVSDRLTVYKDGEPVYRPTVHYAYMPCHETLSSLWELRARNYEMQPKQRIMFDEIERGDDILGALMMGHPFVSWWTGSILSIKEARRVAPHQNATTVQVAIGVVSAVLWSLENPRMGINFPDDLPHDYILKIAKPYLGRLVSVQSDWTPLKNRKVFFKENPQSGADDSDVWHFKNFAFVP